MDTSIPKAPYEGLEKGGRADVPWRRDALALALGFAAFLAHAVVAARYDVFRDELYFIVCGRHPAFGYADQPPGVPLLAASFYALGQSVWLLRLPASLAAGALAWLSFRFARLLGGDAAAGVGAALSVTIAPMLLAVTATLNTTTFDPLAWTALAFLLSKFVKTGDRRALWLCGLVAGVDLELKYALVFWGVSLGAGLLSTRERRIFARKDLWIGVALAGLIAAPSLLWQAMNRFPFLELAAAARDKNADVQPLAFILNQVIVMNPLLAPVWASGLIGPFLVDRLRPVRFLAIGFMVCTALVIATHGKEYYIAACYPAVFVVGAVAISKWVERARACSLMIGYAALAVLFSALMAPLVLPVLPIPWLRAYIQSSPIKLQEQEKGFKGTLLPQEFADQLGWRDFAAEVSKAWAEIPPAERAMTSIKVDNYGEAAALDLYGARAGLPPALSGHNQYFLWGLRGQRPVNLLVVQDHPERLTRFCRQTTVLGLTSSPDAMRYENGKAIAYCRSLKIDLSTIWPSVKHYD